MLLKYTTIFCFSILINSFLFILIKLGLFGNTIKIKFNSLVKKEINTITFLTFLFVLFLLFYLQLNIIYLDTDSEVKTVINNVEVTISGDFLKLVLTHFGAAAVFTTGLRVGHLIVAKNLHTLGKVGIIGGSASGYTLMYKIIANHTLENKNLTEGVTVKTDKVQINVDMPIETELNNVSQIIPNKDSAVNEILNKLLEVNMKNPSVLEQIKLNNLRLLEKKPHIDVISELEKTYPDWRNFPIGSPLENSDLSGLSPIIDLLNTNLLLHFVMLYLLFMVLFIFTSKLLIEKNINLESIKNLPLGYYIHFILNKLINIWKINANLWIYFILINLFVFTFVSSYSLYLIMTSLNNLTPLFFLAVLCIYLFSLFFKY